MRYAIVPICLLVVACSTTEVSAPEVVHAATAAARVSIDRGPVWIAPGCPAQLRAHVYDSAGVELSEAAGWSSDRPDLVTVDPAGAVVTPLGGGGFANSVVLIRAMPAPQVEDTITVYVEASSRSMKMFDFSGNIGHVTAGDSTEVVVLVNGNGDTPYITKWTSSDSSVAVPIVDERFGRDFKPQHGHAVAMVFWRKSGSVTLTATACDGATTSETALVQ